MLPRENDNRLVGGGWATCFKQIVKWEEGYVSARDIDPSHGA
jgi:hypothetical protein